MSCIISQLPPATKTIFIQLCRKPSSSQSCFHSHHNPTINQPSPPSHRHQSIITTLPPINYHHHHIVTNPRLFQLHQRPNLSYVHDNALSRLTLFSSSPSCSTAKIESHVLPKNRNSANAIQSNILLTYRRLPYKSWE